MTHIEVNASKLLQISNVEAAVERAIAAHGLHITLKDTLASYPGCIHWHIKRGRERGVLEITWWPPKQRLWLTVHANRSGAWVEAAAGQIKTALEMTPPQVE